MPAAVRSSAGTRDLRFGASRRGLPERAGRSAGGSPATSPVRRSEPSVKIVRRRPINMLSLLHPFAAATDPAGHHPTGSAVPAVDQTYEYLRPSTMSAGTRDLYLSTSGGTSAGVRESHPRFFDGFVDHPEV